MSVLLGSTLVGCGGDAATEPETVTVFAASSLTDAFTELGTRYEALKPGVDVVLNFAGSSELATQIGQGAPADVFAAADQTSMTALAATGGTASEPAVFATNRAAILVAAGNPTGITGVADLADPELIVVVCSPQVPCGSYAQQVFAAVGATVTPRSFEENVKAVVAKVVLGEADAGIVYASDLVTVDDRAQGVEIPDESNVVARYPIATTREGPNPDGAQDFVDFVLSDGGRAILASYGFGPP